MSPSALRAFSIALPAIAGALTFIYSLLLALRGPQVGDGWRRQAARRFFAGACLIAVLALVIIVIFMRVVEQPGWFFALLAWLLTLFVAWVEMMSAGRGKPDDLLRGAGAVGLLAFSLAMIGARLAVTAPLAFALGALTAALVLHGAAVCARLLDGKEKEPWLPDLSAAAIFATCAAAFSIAVHLGRLHFPNLPVAIYYPFLIGSVGALACMVGLALAGGVFRVGRFSIMAIIVVALSLLVDYPIKSALFDEANMFATVATGMLCGLIVLLLSQIRFLGKSLGAEAVGLAGVCVGLGLAVAFRFAGGYGVSLAAIGIACIMPFAGALSSLAAKGAQQPDASIQAQAGAAALAGRATLAAAVAITAGALVRAYTAANGVAVVNVNHSNTFAALVLGGTVPFVIGALLLRGSAIGPLSERLAAGSRLGLVCGMQALWVAILSAGAVLAAAFFFRSDAVAGYMVGLAAASLFVMFMSILAGEEATAKVASAGALACVLFSGIVGIVFAPSVVSLQEELTRAQKAKVLDVVALAVALWLIAEALYRSRRKG